MFQALLDSFADPEHHQGFWVMVQAIGSVVSAAVIIVAAIYARGQLKEARELREAQSRPFVVIEFNVQASSVIKIRVSNIGSTMARNIHFQIDPPLQSRKDTGWKIMDLQMFKSGIGTLAPGRVIEFFYDSWIGMDMVTVKHKVLVTYEGDKGRRYENERMDLDLGLYHGLSFIPEHGLHDIHKQLEGIAKTLSDFKAWGGGLLALSPTDVKKRDEEWHGAVEQQIAKEKAQVESQKAAPQLDIANGHEAEPEKETGA